MLLTFTLKQKNIKQNNKQCDFRHSVCDFKSVTIFIIN